ncbi:hypothetical protein ERO13_A11G256850v2 [Gossypium hirsutum]|uniref:Uncharacterized protein n=1 Tax=Gossypium darwinii TaxID=34276 RepID=A0A5D2ES06_GOSDA|nr:hypothetical protein ERO13_A11G256850v2 [Gossypium hirsutum]TYG95839.1 hypothetical protein ES288_A11G300300v1 [Gossypium darwinii]
MWLSLLVPLLCPLGSASQPSELLQLLLLIPACLFFLLTFSVLVQSDFFPFCSIGSNILFGLHDDLTSTGNSLINLADNSGG